MQIIVVVSLGEAIQNDALLVLRTRLLHFIRKDGNCLVRLSTQ